MKKKRERREKKEERRRERERERESAGACFWLMQFVCAGGDDDDDDSGGRFAWRCLLLCSASFTLSNAWLSITAKKKKNQVNQLNQQQHEVLWCHQAFAMLLNLCTSVLYNTCQATKDCLPPLSVSQPATNAIQLVGSTLLEASDNNMNMKMIPNQNNRKQQLFGISLVVAGIFLLSS